MIRRAIIVVWFALAMGVFGVAANVIPAAFAQDQIELSAEPPDFTAQSLTTRKTALSDLENLPEDQFKSANDFYQAAINALNNAETNLETAKRLKRELGESPQTIAVLSRNLETARAAVPDDTEDAPVESDELIKLEQELIAQEGKLSDLRAEVARHNSSLENLLQRPVAARDELSEARAKLSEIKLQVETLNGGDLSPVDSARRASLRARKYFRETQILALQQESGGRVARQEILTLRRDIAQANAEATGKRVAYLQSKTGQSRVNEADKVLQQNEATLAAIGGIHPYITSLAQANVDLSKELKQGARESGRFPKQEAEIRDLVKVVNEDLTVAKQLIELGDLNRESSATLRRLRDKVIAPKSIRAEMENTRAAIVRATQDRLLAQEELREISIDKFNVNDWVRLWLGDNPEAAPLASDDIEIVGTLFNSRRDLLKNISSAATNRVEVLIALESSQSELLSKSEELTDILDQNLLWLPSVSAIDFRWPGRIIRGVGTVFSGDNLRKSAQVPLASAKERPWITVIFGIVIFCAIFVRTQIAQDIKERAQYVGRVQKDSYWHTPTVILGCIIIALPLPLLFFTLARLYQISGNVSPFVEGLQSAFDNIALLLLFFLTWREWNRDKSLFDAHMKMPKAFRHGIYKHFRWFIPLAAVSTGAIALTEQIPEPDVYEGLSVLAFIVTAVALSVFAYKVLWSKRSSLETFLSPDGMAWRYRRPIMVLLVGLPMFAAILAAAGYYETASVLLGRLFFSSWLLIGTYVIYGLVRRTIMVAQRRLHLRQAIERRDNAIKAREEKAAAEERGDIPPTPQVDYKEIDVESMSRQTSQLLYTAMAFGFAALMWMIWSDLLPALSSFNKVEFWPYQGFDSEGNQITLHVTLWSLIQVLVIIFLTFIAAKNLPGFLEIFVLNRAGFDPGTRYAIVTIMGYIIVAIGVLMMFDRLGLEWSKLQWLVAGLGVGIGFGLQEIIANFISGLIILFERPVRIGDYVTIGDQSGTVSRIQIRSVTIADLDSRETLIPNKELITGRVTNWTLSSTVTRMKIQVGVAYGSDTEKVQAIILDVLKQQNLILEKPAPQAMFLGFGDSSLNFEIRVFIKSMDDRFPVQHSIHTDINKAFVKEGISIPFPQRDLHIIADKVPAEFEPKSKPTPKAKKQKSPQKPKTA